MATKSIMFKKEDMNFLMLGVEKIRKANSIVKKKMQRLSITQKGKLRREGSHGWSWGVLYRKRFPTFRGKGKRESCQFERPVAVSEKWCG